MRVGELRKILSHGAIYAVGALLARVVSFLMMPVYTRALSPAEYGVVDLLDTTAAVIVNLANVAITYSVMRFYYDVEDSRARGRVISTALAGLLAFGTVAVAAAWPLAVPLSRAMFHSPDYALALRMMAVTAVFYGLIEVPMTFIRALERPGLYMAVSLGRLVIGLVLNLVFVVWLRWGVMGVVWANVYTSLITVAGLAAFTLPKTGFAISRKVLLGMLAFGAPFIPGSLAMLVLHNGDRYILSSYRSLSEVGIYSLGYKLGMIITYAISVPFANVWSTRMYTVVREPGGTQTYARVGTYFVYTLLFAWVALSAAAPEAVAVAASPEFAGAASFVPVIAAGYILREASEFWKNAFLIEKRTRTLAWTQPVIAVANIALTWFLVRADGAAGAAWATTVTFVLLLMLTVGLAERILPTGMNQRHLATAVAAAGALFALSRAVPPMPLALSLLIKLLITALFPVCLVALRAVPPDDRAAALAFVGRWAARVRGRASPSSTVDQSSAVAPRGSLNP